jgi:hypothetical protein
MRGIEDLGVIHRNDDVMFLNAGGFGRVGHVFDRHAPSGAILNGCHMDAQFRKGERFPGEEAVDNPLGERRRYGECHTAAVGLRFFLLGLNDRMHDADDFSLTIEEAAA